MSGSSVAKSTSPGRRARDDNATGFITAAGEVEVSLLSDALVRSPDHVVLVDRTHRITFFNFLDRGLTEDDVLGAPLERFVPSASREWVHAAIDEVFRTGESSRSEVEVVTPEGPLWVLTRFGPVMADGHVERVAVFSTDITDARRSAERAAKALHESEARFRTLFEAAPDAIYILDPETMRFVDANDNALRLYGLREEDVAKHGPLDFSPAMQPDGTPSTEALEAALNSVLSEGPKHVEWTHGTASGQTILCDVLLAPFPGPKRSLIRATVQDISEHERSEREREQLNEQAHKMQAMGQLTGGVAHDVNNLLTVIISSLSMVEMFASDTEKVGQFAAHAGDAANRAADLTRRLLAFAGKQPLAPRPLVDFVQQSGGAPQGHGELVLVLEDDPGVRHVTVSLLEKLGYTTVAAASAEQARARLDEEPGIRMMLSDVVIGGPCTGLDVAREARVRRPGLPVVFMSGYAHDALSATSPLDPDTPLLQKPFSLSQLATAVHAALQQG